MGRWERIEGREALLILKGFNQDRKRYGEPPMKRSQVLIFRKIVNEKTRKYKIYSRAGAYYNEITIYGGRFYHTDDPVPAMIEKCYLNKSLDYVPY